MQCKRDTAGTLDQGVAERKLLGIQVARISHLAEVYLKAFCSIRHHCILHSCSNMIDVGRNSPSAHFHPGLLALSSNSK